MLFELEKVKFEQEIGGVDLLGFQTAFERTFTDKIIPGITVLTWDVRYYGFICWVISIGKDPSSEDSYQMEQKLAFRLAKHYRGKKEGKYLGSRKASKNIKEFRPPYYKTPIWPQYKSSMLQLGLIEKDLNASFGYSLTKEKGRKLAMLFNQVKFDRERGLRDENISGVKELFLKILFDGDNNSKARKKYKIDLIKASKSDNFYKSLESSKKPILKNAAVTAQLIQKLTDAFLIFYDDVKKYKKISIKDSIKVAGIMANDKLKKALNDGRAYLKKWDKINKKNKEFNLAELIKPNDEDMIERIINRHLEVKKDNPLLEKKECAYIITDNKRPDSAGFFGLRQGALDLLLKSLDRTGNN